MQVLYIVLVNFYCIFDLRQINFLLKIYFLQILLKLNYSFLWWDHTKSREQYFSVGFWCTQPATTLNQSSGWKLRFWALCVYLFVHIFYSFRQRLFRNTFECDYLVASIYTFLGTVARHVLCHPPGAMLKRATETCWKAMLHVLPPTFEPVLQQIALQGFFSRVLKGAKLNISLLLPVL